MNKIFIGLIIIGLIGVISVLLLGTRGAYIYNVAIALFALKKGRFDERELLLNMRVFVITISIAILTFITFYIVSFFQVLPLILSTSWFGIIIGYGLIIGGISGLIIYRTDWS